MADSTIGDLPQATALDDDSLLAVEQQGTAKSVAGSILKSFVENKVDQYAVDAKTDADRAEAAATSILNLGVAATTLASGQSATVTKSAVAGTVKLTFGIPMGAKGDKGDKGDTGARGAQGSPGTGLTILGYYDTIEDLQASEKNPKAGDTYAVGEESPYDIYTWDANSGTWKNNGEVTGIAGEGVPTGGTVGQALLKLSSADYDTAWLDIPSAEDVITTSGGAEMKVDSTLGSSPYKIIVTEESDSSDGVTASDVSYSSTSTGMSAANVQEAVDELFTSVSDGKAIVASAVTDMGITTAEDATFSTIAANVKKISAGSGGTDISDATATAGDILVGKTAYIKGGKTEGVIPLLTAQTWTPTTSNQTIANGQYISGTQTIKGDTNLTSSNIREGVTLFGVEGAMSSTFLATLTVTVDSGAVVTATHTNGTEVSALCEGSNVVIELPIEGEWSITAVRGVTYYNTATVTVSSHYSCSLAANLHIEYFGNITALDYARGYMAAASNSKYAIFAGGYDDDNRYGIVEAYDTELVKSNAEELSSEKAILAAASSDSYVLFGGGITATSAVDVASAIVTGYDVYLTKINVTKLSERRYNLAGGANENYYMFGGGFESYTTSSTFSSVYHSTVEAYDPELTRSIPTPLITGRTRLAAAANANYVIFGGGVSVEGNDSYFYSYVDAYSTSLTRSTPSPLSEARMNITAARAGEYVVFAGGNIDTASYDTVEAYDLYLTKSTPEKLGVARHFIAGATFNDFAIFGGGCAVGSSKYLGTVEAYDMFLVRTQQAELNVCRRCFGAACVGNYALFGGGEKSYGTYVKTVEAYRYV